MHSIEFKEQTLVIAEDQPQYTPLPAKRVKGPHGEVITCWQLTPEDLEAIKENGGVIYMHTWTFNTAFHPIRFETKLTPGIDEQPAGE